MSFWPSASAGSRWESIDFGSQPVGFCSCGVAEAAGDPAFGEKIEIQEHLAAGSCPFTAEGLVAGKQPRWREKKGLTAISWLPSVMF